MDILCDIIATDPAGSRILATSTPLGWLFPTVRARESARVISPVQGLLKSVNLDVTVVHESWLPAIDGHTPEPRRYCFVVAKDPAGVLKPVEWIDLDRVLNARFAFPSHMVALQTCLKRLRHPIAPFDTPSCIDEAEQWIDAQLTRLDRVRLASPRLIGADRFYRVAEIQTNRGTVYFKGGADTIVPEARVTGLVADCAPGFAADTLALDERGWWLMSLVPGASLAERSDKPGLLRALQTLASIQMKLASSQRTAEALDVTVTMADLRAAVDGTLREIGKDIDEKSAAKAARTCDRIAAVLESPEPPPLTWVHSDLAPANVLVSEARPAFIDLNSSVRSVPVLPLWRLLNGCRQRGIIDGCELPACYAAYEQPWREAGYMNFGRFLPHLRELGILLRIWIGWQAHHRLRRDEPNTYEVESERESLRRLVAALGAAA